LLALARRTVAIINQNMLCGFLFILLAVALSSFGWVSPIVAAFIHEFSAFFVILNSARLLRFQTESRVVSADTSEGDFMPAQVPVAAWIARS
jgi:cation transport ATPase